MSIAHGALALCAIAVVPALLAAQAERMLEVPKDGKAIAYHTIGTSSAAPLLLINGGPGLDHSYLHLNDVWRRFGRTRQVVFFDQPGTGGSSPIGAQDTITIADLLDGIESIRTTLKAEQLDVLGHSWGGYLAMAYAIRHPDRVRRMILVGSSAPEWSTTEFLLASLFPDSLARGASWRLDDPVALQEDFRRHVFMGIYSPAIRSRVLANWRTVPYNRRQAQLLLAETRATNLQPKVATLATPTLVTTGRYDAVVSPRTAWNIHRQMPGSRFFVFEQSGHYPMVEEPEVFVTTIERFLRAQ